MRTFTLPTGRTTWRATAAAAATTALVGAGIAATATPASAASWWKPGNWHTFHIQYTGTMDYSVNATVFNLDGADTSAATVDLLHRKGKRVVCYFSGGSWEDWRDDSHRFPSWVKGEPLDGWPGESWLDIRRLDVLMPIMQERINTCRAKGFDGIDVDNMDVHTQNSGFAVQPHHQVAYHKALADAAHAAGLAYGMKNDVEQIPEVEPFADFAVNESCEEWDECHTYAPFIRNYKPVFHITYDKKNFANTCRSVPRGLRTTLKNMSLDAWRKNC